MSALREAAQQALEALIRGCNINATEWHQAIYALRAALAQQDEPRNQCGETCERAKLCATCAQVLAQQAEGGGNLPPPLQAVPVAAVAENATTQQRVVETPPSDYRRGYWDGFNIGKREGRIEAEDALAQQAEPQGCATEEDCTKQPWCRIRGECLRKQAEPDHETRAELAEQQVVQLAEERDHYRNLWQKAQQAEPVQEPVAYIHRQGNHWEVSERELVDDERARGWTEEPLYTAPPQRRPLTEEEVDKIFKHLCNTVGASCKTMARAVERAHGIKE